MLQMQRFLPLTGPHLPSFVAPHQINEMLDEQGRKPIFTAGFRVTDEETMDMAMVRAGPAAAMPLPSACAARKQLRRRLCFVKCQQLS